MPSPDVPRRAADDEPEAHLPEHHNPLPALSHGHPVPISGAAFQEVQASEEFQMLRTRFRRFAFPMTAAFLAWYFAYVLLSVYAKEWMSTPVFGENFNLGHLLGLFQFLTTFVITWLYIRHANTRIDPLAGDIRSRLEGGAR